MPSSVTAKKAAKKAAKKPAKRKRKRKPARKGLLRRWAEKKLDEAEALGAIDPEEASVIRARFSVLEFMALLEIILMIVDRIREWLDERRS